MIADRHPCLGFENCFCRQAKVDALSAIARCVENWGWQSVAAYAGRIWWALRDELMDPLEPNPSEGESNTAVAAAACLQRCLAAEAGPQMQMPVTVEIESQSHKPVQSLLDKVG